VAKEEARAVIEPSLSAMRRARTACALTSAPSGMSHVYKIPLVLTPQPEGGYTVESPVLPELVTEGDSLEEAL
jgi:hypothetical protein